MITEQVPRVSYTIALLGGSVHVNKSRDVVKITKEKNPQLAVKPAKPTPPAPPPPAPSVVSPLMVTSAVATMTPPGPAEAGEPMPEPEPASTDVAPTARVRRERKGFAIDAAAVVAFPLAYFADPDTTDASFRPSLGFSAVLGHERVSKNNIGITLGFQLRAIPWRYVSGDGETYDTLSIEPEAYLRVARYQPRFSVYGSGALGADMVNTDLTVPGVGAFRSQSRGFGMNLGLGGALILTRNMVATADVQWHPGTTTVISDDDGGPTVTYAALLFGLRFYP